MSASTETLNAHANRLRATALSIAQVRGQGYIGQALGTAEILACLFFDDWRFQEEGAGRDRFVLSPGHYALALYSVMGEDGRIPIDELKTYGMDGSEIEESPLEGLTGFEITGGSLAQGLSQAIGLALGKRLLAQDGAVVCLISDGELGEGQTWEALLCAGSRQLPNLTIVLDRNGRQVDGPTEQILRLEPVESKLSSFGIANRRIDGHNVDAVREALRWARDEPGTAAVICDTQLGHGVPAMADAAYPHYVRADAETWIDALAQLDAEPGLEP
jgi:transketolase